MQLHDLTLTELAAGLAAKRFSSREIVDSLLGRIAKANNKLHAFTEVYATEAKALAQVALNNAITAAWKVSHGPDSSTASSRSY